MLTRPSSSASSFLSEESLTCDVVPERGRVWVRLQGTLDLVTSTQLDEQLDDLRSAGFRQLTVDLRELSFMDSTGLRLVLSWDTAAREDGFGIEFVRGRPQVHRVFELTGLADRINFVRP